MANSTAAALKKMFNCRQNQLYVICFLAWKYYQQNLAAFSLFRGAYTSQVGEDAVKAINAAKSLMGVEERNQVTSETRVKTQKAAKAFCKKWVTLRRYVVKVYEGAELEVNLIAAGSSYYKKANTYDWDALASLIQGSTAFINLKKDELMHNNNMSADFLANFLKDAENCTTLMLDYKELSVNKRSQSMVKLKANNTIYETMIAMLTDGQDIFINDKEVREKFIYARLYEQVKSQSPASIRGYMLGPDGKGLAGVTVTIQNTEQVVVTNKKGYYSFNRLAGDKSYMIIATLENYVTHYEGVILKAGTAKHLNLQLQPVVASTQSIEKHMQTAEAV